MNGRLWTKKELRYLKKHYSDTPTWKLAEQMNRSKCAIFGQAYKLALKKSEAFLNSPFSGRLPAGFKGGVKTQFKPGHIPHNKGKEGWQAGGNSIKTRFKKEHRPQNWHPIGSHRFSKDDYLQIKVTDTGYPPRDWKCVHVILWEQHHGPVPEGFIVIFRNKNKTDINIENLECISRAENMRRNTIHRMPKPLADVIRIRGVLNRQINKREGRHEKQDRRSEKSSVCHH